MRRFGFVFFNPLLQFLDQTPLGEYGICISNPLEDGPRDIRQGYDQHELP